MSNPEHISTIFLRVLKQLEEDQKHGKEEREIEAVFQESVVEAGKV